MTENLLPAIQEVCVLGIPEIAWCLASLPSMELRANPFPYISNISLVWTGTTCPRVHTEGLTWRNNALEIKKFWHAFSRSSSCFFSICSLQKSETASRSERHVKAKTCSLNSTGYKSLSPIIALIRNIKLCRNLSDSPPVKRYENALGFPFPISNHLNTSFAKRERLASVFRLVISPKKGECVLTFWNSFTFRGNLDISIENSRIWEKKRAHALFFKCRGSTCAFSISLPILGANSCLDYFSAISEVILHRLVLALRVVFASLLFNSSTCLATFTRLP